MFFYTDRTDAPSMITRADDKRRARLNAMQFPLSSLPCPRRDPHIVRAPSRSADRRHFGRRARPGQRTVRQYLAPQHGTLDLVLADAGLAKEERFRTVHLDELAARDFEEPRSDVPHEASVVRHEDYRRLMLEDFRF